MNLSFWDNKKVFITGDTGFKGSWLAYWLLNLGANVYGYALEPDTDKSLYTILNLKKEYDSERQDIRDFDKLSASIKRFNPEIIFHLAAQPLVKESYINPIYTYSTNVIGTANLLEASRNISSIRSIIVVTTDKVYKNLEKNKSYKESDVLGGHDPYSSSKACTELLLDSFRNSFFNEKNIPLISARAGNVIGGGDWSPNRIIPDVVKSLYEGQELLVRSPNSIRPWQHVIDPLAGYLLLAEKSFQNWSMTSSAWNLGPLFNSHKTVLDVLEVMKEFNKSLHWKLDDQVHEHEASLLMLDISKAINKLNWTPKFSFEKSIELTSEWYSCYYSGADIRKVTDQQLNLNYKMYE